MGELDAKGRDLGAPAGVLAAIVLLKESGTKGCEPER